MREVFGSCGWQTGRACNELRNFSNGKSKWKDGRRTGFTLILFALACGRRRRGMAFFLICDGEGGKNVADLKDEFLNFNYLYSLCMLC